MKRTIITNILALTLSVSLLISYTLSSCTNDGDIGDLYGNWQIKEISKIDTIATPSHLFLSFQSNVVYARVVDEEAHFGWELHGKFSHIGDSLMMTYFPMDNVGEILQQYIKDEFLFDDYKNIRLRVDHLNDSHMILSQGNSRWTLHKF